VVTFDIDKSTSTHKLPKCLYHFWNYSFTSTRKPFLQSSQIGPSVTIQVGDRSRSETVPFRSAYESYKTLGYYKSPCGSQAKQCSVLQLKCNNPARIVSTSAMTRSEAWTYYFSMYLTSPGYPLPLSHFSASELYALETKSLPAMNAKCSFNRNTSRKVLYGGFRPFATEQGIGQIQYLMKHWTSTLDIGRAQRIAVSWAQMHTGIGWSIFLDVETTLPHFQESHWLRSMRSFLKSIQGSICLDHLYVPSLQRTHDSHIMDHVLSSGQFRPIEVRAINYCRLYLQAVTVSDITNATGTRLFHGVTRGSVTDILSTTKWHLTYQAKPDTASWKLWKKANYWIGSIRPSINVASGRSTMIQPPIPCVTMSWGSTTLTYGGTSHLVSTLSARRDSLSSIIPRRRSQKVVRLLANSTVLLDYSSSATSRLYHLHRILQAP
jgi:hypothetical protein